MKKFIFLLLFFPVISYAKVVKGTMPIFCATNAEVIKTLKEYEETPLLVGVSTRDYGNGEVTFSGFIIFVNTKTGTFTITEQVEENKACVIAVGEELKPYERKSGI